MHTMHTSLCRADGPKRTEPRMDIGLSTLDVAPIRPGFHASSKPLFRLVFPEMCASPSQVGGGVFCAPFCICDSPAYTAGFIGSILEPPILSKAGPLFEGSSRAPSPSRKQRHQISRLRSGQRTSLLSAVPF